MIIKKKLFIARDADFLVIRDGDNFEASFNINDIGGSLSFGLPYVGPDYRRIDVPEFRLDRIKKFDYVFLFYAEIEEDREPKPEEWFQIFNGYVENVSLNKTKNNWSYVINCNCMLGLSNYLYSYTQIRGGDIALMPLIILQNSNMQVGEYNYMQNVAPQDLIPTELMDIQINTIFGKLVCPGFSEKNCKNIIDEFRAKYGLIFTENMDGVVQVTTLTNYLSQAENYKFVFKNEIKNTPEERVKFSMQRLYVGQIEKYVKASENLKANMPKVVVGIGTYLDILTLNTPLCEKLGIGLGGIKKGILNLSNYIVGKTGGETLSKAEIDYVSGKLSFQSLAVSSLLRKGYLEIVNELNSIITEDTEREINDVLLFDVNENIFEVRYPDVSTEYDGVVVYGYQDVGEAIDLTSIALKNIQPDPVTGKYNLNLLKLYRRDLNNRFELNKVAREELYKIKQENKISFKTIFSPLYRIGMPFTIMDYDRYTSNELFICTKISYTISKDNVECEIEGMSSFLNTLPEKVVVDDARITDIIHLGLEDKIKNQDWQNSWQ